MSNYSKERIEFDSLLRSKATPNYAALHLQAQPLERTGQLQAIASGPRHVPIVLKPPPASQRLSTQPYCPPVMGTTRRGAYDALRVPSLLFNHRTPSNRHD